MILSGEHVAIFGITGSGKSTLTAKVAALFARRIIFDRLVENHFEGAAIVTDYFSFANAYKGLHEHKSFTIIYRPKPGTSPDDIQISVDAILQLVYQVEQFDSLGISLIFEEAWIYAPLHYISPWMQETILTGRHYKISIIANSQRPAHVNKALISQARHVFIGQFFEFRDRKYYADTFGDIPQLDNPPEKFNFYWFKTGIFYQLIST